MSWFSDELIPIAGINAPKDDDCHPLTTSEVVERDSWVLHADTDCVHLQLEEEIEALSRKSVMQYYLCAVGRP